MPNTLKSLSEMVILKQYFLGIWSSRYFWIHLSLADLRSRWRRSFLGIFWTIIQPLGLTILVAIVFGKMFKIDIGEYAPYILSGLIVWSFITVVATGGSLAFVQADAYIKQMRHPLAIYTLRSALTELIILALASLSLIVWVLVVMPQNFGWHWLAALTIFPVMMMIGWPLATILAYIATRFRDLPHALALILQAFWFISPIYFEARLFRDGGLSWLVDYNPIYHWLQIVRAPMLQGEWPTLENYIFSGASILVFFAIALLIGMRAERKVIFYL